MAKLNPFLRRWIRFGPKLAYAGIVAMFFWVAWRSYMPGKGFTYLLEIGDRQHARLLPELKAMNHFELPDSYGYDGQFYAEIAMRPHLSDPVLAAAVDSLPYRARRILFSWTAWIFGGGSPARAVNAYAVQSLVSWLLLALLLLRWFPPTGWGNFFRWGCVLFSFGMCHSLRASLVDGPSLLLITLGLALLESKRPWAAAAVLGISGLGRETNVLAGVAFAPRENSARAWICSLALSAVVVLPMVVWLWVLWRLFGTTGGGGGNFAIPLSGYLGKWAESLQELGQDQRFLAGLRNLATVLALGVQFLFLCLRRRWTDPWWRVGAVFAVMMIVLGEPVWAGYPPAAARVLLPMTLAFNILAPRGRRWWIVLILGNLNVLASKDVLRLPTGESYRIEGPRDLRMVRSTGEIVEPIFDRRWYPPEHSYFEFWRWSDGPSSLAVRNPQPFALSADVSFSLHTIVDRPMAVRAGGRILWEGIARHGPGTKIELRGLRLDPGDTILAFDTQAPAGIADGDVRGPPVFNLRNLDIIILGRPER